MARIFLFLTKCGVKSNKLRFRQHMSNEMAHYACDCWDAECHSSYGWVECVGCADRSAYDLTQHTQHSGQKLIAERQLAKPKVLDRTQIHTDKSVIGKTFKKDAASIQKYFDQLTTDQIVNEIEPKIKTENELEVTIEDKVFKIPTNIISVKRFQETLHGKKTKSYFSQLKFLIF